MMPSANNADGGFETPDCKGHICVFETLGESLDDVLTQYGKIVDQVRRQVRIIEC